MRLDLCYAADFETTTDLKDCRVWAYALCNVDDPNEFIYGNSIEEFFKFCESSKKNLKIWFHNLRFDGIFIITQLIKDGFKYVEDAKHREEHSYTTLISDIGQFYSITVYFKVTGHHTKKVEFFDSLKIFPNFSVERIAESFNLPISKLKIDYKAFRPVGHILTNEEVAYIRNDVEIVARALKEMFKRGLTKMTIASDAMSYFRGIFIGFKKKFPVLPKEVDEDVRASYRGGFTYVNDCWKEVDNKVGGITLDVNSLYPSCMLAPNLLPYGVPRKFEGDYVEDPVYPLYVINFSCKFELKKNKIPCIQIKHGMFVENEYLKSSNGAIVELTLTSVDYKLFREQYNVENIKFFGGWKFKAAAGMFDDYIHYWAAQKIKADQEGNKPLRVICKAMLNSLYGRYGISSNASQKVPYLKDDGSIGFRVVKQERETLYVPVASFITALGRYKTITTSQVIKDYTLKKYGEDRYYYSDSDSIHANLSDEDLEELKDVVMIDDRAIGYWALEAVYQRCCYLRQKCYIEEIDGKVHVTVAGLPKYLAPIINFDNFKKGFTTKGLTLEDMKEMAKRNGASDEEIEELHHKLTYKYVKGGVVLTDTDFTIKN